MAAPNPVLAGLACRCPNCGEGPLFAGFLKVSPRCEACGLDLAKADSGDGPAVFVILIAGFVVAFGALSPYRPKPAFARTAEDSVYVAGGRRGEGLGRLVLDALLRRAQAAGHHSVIARITAQNTASLRLHARCGFQTVGVERESAFKLGRWLDVVILQRALAAR